MLTRVRAAIMAVIFFGGCGKAPPPPIVEAEGIVRLDGRPLNNVEVRFIPSIDYGSEYVARGVTDKAGRFTLTCKGQPGACACENRVVIVEAALPGRLKGENAQAELARYLQSLGGRPLPQKYANLADNPLVVNVTAEQQEYPIELTSDP
jgi:hypothetical protein